MTSGCAITGVIDKSGKRISGNEIIRIIEPNLDTVWALKGSLPVIVYNS